MKEKRLKIEEAQETGERAPTPKQGKGRRRSKHTTTTLSELHQHKLQVCENNWIRKIA